MPIEKDRVGLVLLGSQVFPKSKNFVSSKAFFNSYQKIKSLFCDAGCLGVPAHHTLDLFDSEHGPDDQDALVSTYIQNLKDSRQITDLIIYYIGHGSYAPENGGYLLAIRTSRDDNLGISSITMKSLARTVSKKARNIRTFIILDCCFSGDARHVFQSPQNDLLRKAIEDDFPTEGVALFCSSSSADPSLIIPERNITMFTEAFEKALRRGTHAINRPYLSLHELKKLTFQFIKELNPGEFVRPEVHTPSQGAGDIAEIPHFPNLGFKVNGYDILAREKLLEAKVIHNDLSGLGAAFMDFVSDFDVNKKYRMEAILIGSDCNDLNETFIDLKRDRDEDENKREKFRDKRRELYVKILSIVHDLTTSKL